VADPQETIEQPEPPEETPVVEPLPEPIDFTARAEEMRRLGTEKQAALSRLLEGDLSALCPRGTCSGEIAVTIPGHEDPYPMICPLHLTAACPRYEQQVATDDRRFLRELLHCETEDFELLHASPDKLTEAFRPVVLRWCETAPARLEKGEGVILSGGQGSGKSMACVLLAKAAHHAGASVCWVESGQAFDEMFSREYDHLNPAADLLILDDFGFEYRSEVVMPRFHMLVNRRWYAKKATVVATMLDPKALLAEGGLKAIFSRLRQRNVWKDTAQEDRRRPATLEDWS